MEQPLCVYYDDTLTTIKLFKKKNSIYFRAYSIAIYRNILYCFANTHPYQILSLPPFCP